MLESQFQAELIKDIEFLFPGCVILKNDSGYRQGFPDLTVLWHERWAVLECKRSARAPYQPNQEWYLDKLAALSFATTVYPENKKDVLTFLKEFFDGR